MRLIDANALFDALEESKNGLMKMGLGEAETVQTMTGLNMAQLSLSIAPTIDAAPVVYGEWEKYPGSGNYSRRCSRCHDYYTDEPARLRFCPRCGAKMEEYTVPNLSCPNEEKFPWRYPESEWGRKWHLASEQLPTCSGVYSVVLCYADDPDSETMWAVGAHYNGVGTWTLSPEYYGGKRDYAVKYWKEAE